MKKQWLALLGFALLLLTAVSCRRDNWLDDALLESSQDNASAQSDFDEVFRYVDEEAQKNDDLRSPCTPTVTTVFSQPDSFPATTTIDFGAACTGADGRTRSGQIIATYTGRYRTPGTVVTIVLQNYTVNGRAIEGTKTVTNLGPNADGHLVYSVTVANGSITAANGSVRTFSGTWNREWAEGQQTTFATDGLAGLQDDVWLITGTATGTRANGTAFTASTLTPLRKEADCRYCVSGSLEIVPAGGGARLFDFGNGNCDDQATVSYNGNTRTITLP